jgi:hypothetical protein
MSKVHSIPGGLFLKIAYERHTVAFTLKIYCDDIRKIMGH